VDSILFLDFDGVTHPTGGNAEGRPFGQLPLLEALLREPEFERVNIVISSTWREAFSISRLRHRFAPDMRARVISVTPVVDDYEGPHRRAWEIRAWLALHPEVTRWTVLDDMVEGFPADWREHVVFTHGDTGLVQADLPRLRAHLLRGPAGPWAP
jgi:hypothetical protein